FYFKTDQPLITLDAAIGAGAGVGLYIVNVGIDAVLGSEVRFQFTDPNHNGKIYLNQLETPCALVESGDVYAQAQAFVTIGVSIFSVTFTIDITPKITLFSFTTSCQPPVLAHFDGQDSRDSALGVPAGTLVLNVGPYSDLRLPGASDGS